jgi:hypothetical protein
MARDRVGTILVYRTKVRNRTSTRVRTIARDVRYC